MATALIAAACAGSAVHFAHLSGEGMPSTECSAASLEPQLPVVVFGQEPNAIFFAEGAVSPFGRAFAQSAEASASHPDRVDPVDEASVFPLAPSGQSMAASSPATSTPTPPAPVLQGKQSVTPARKYSPPAPPRKLVQPLATPPRAPVVQALPAAAAPSAPIAAPAASAAPSASAAATARALDTGVRNPVILAKASDYVFVRINEKTTLQVKKGSSIPGLGTLVSIDADGARFEQAHVPLAK